MLKVRRFDQGELSKPVQQPNGWLRAEGWITRVGVFNYRRADGSTIRELRSADEVFSAAALESFGLVPLTNGHPASGLLDAENTKEHQVGTVVAPHADGERVRSQILITDAATIKEMQAGKTELSCGYVCDLDESPGEFNGERYDAIQRNIRGNHVALVAVGRAGPTVCVRVDSADAAMVASNLPDAIHKESHLMINVRIDGIDYPATEAGAPAIAQAVEKLTKRTADELAVYKSKADQASARADAAESAAKKAAEELAAAPKRIKEELIARVALETKATEILGEAKFDGLTDNEIKRQVAEHVHGMELKGKSADYVSVSYDLAVKQFNEEQDTPASAPFRTDAGGDRDIVADAKRKFKEALDKVQPR